MSRRYRCGALVGVLATAGALTAAASARPASSQVQAKPSMMRIFNGKPSKPVRPRRTNNLYYHGGVGGIGVETAPKVYLVLWGSQWNNNDPSGESVILQNFYKGVGGSSWNNSVTQYCQGVGSGTVACNGAGQAAGNPSGMFAGLWADTGSAALPNRASRSWQPRR